MASFGKPQNIKLSRWHAFVIIFLISSCHYIFLADSASAQSCNPSWDVLGTSGIKTTYKSGETISGNISFKLNNPSSCPSCIQQILVAIVDSQNKVIDVQCVYNGAPKACPQWTTGTASFSLKNPNTLGAYKIIAADYYQYSCSDAVGKFPNPYNPTPPYYYKDITTITVYAPSSASPPQENISGQICAGNWDISGTSGIKTNYQLGETISGDISFKINNPSDCPTCIQQILVGLVDSQNKVIDVKCIYDGTPKMCPLQTTGTAEFSPKTPAVPGNYQIIAANYYQDSCSDALKKYLPNQVGSQAPLVEYKIIGTITVVATDTTNNGEQVTAPTLPTSVSSDDGKKKDTINVLDTNTLVILCFIVAMLILLVSYSRSRKATKKSIGIILLLVLFSFAVYLVAKYGIPVITKWVGENKSTIIGVLLLLGVIVIAGIAVWKNWNKIPRLPSGTRESPRPHSEPSGTTSSTIKGMRFEQKCKAVLENMGFSCETTKTSGDGGIDLKCHTNKPIVGGLYIVQCKDWKNRPVGEPQIRDLFGTINSEHANKGILITSSYFTKAAMSFAEGKNIELIDGNKLNKLAETD